MNIIGIIQARLGSTRLPAKIAKPLLGKSMLANLVERCLRTDTLTDLIVATPAKDLTQIAALVKGFGITTYANIHIAEDDLISRFVTPAMYAKADYVVRICSDNPCIDPANIDLLVKQFLEEGRWSSLGSNLGDWERTQWPQGLGVEIYSMQLLEWMHYNLHEPEQREHPHTHLHEIRNVWEPDCPFEEQKPLRLN